MSIFESVVVKKIRDISKPGITQSQTAPQIFAYQDLEAFKGLQDHWSLLLQQSQNQAIFLTWEWLFAWEKHLGKQEKLWVITAWVDNDLVGIAPLMLKKIKKHGMDLNLLCSLGSPHIDVGGFIVRDNNPQIYRALCNYLISQKNDWDLLELDEVEVEKGSIGLLKSIFRQSGFSTLETDNRHFYIDTSGDWNTYFQALPKKNRHEFRRKAKNVEISACAKFVRSTGLDITCADMATMFSINKHGHFPGFYQPHEEQGFQLELLRHMSQKGWLDISFLYLDDEPAAFCYGFIYNQRLEIWRIGFDTKYQYLSAGIVLMNWVLEDSFNRNIREVDFLRGEESYKEQWKPQSHTYTQLRVASNKKLKPLMVSVFLPKLSKYIHTQYERISARFFREQRLKNNHNNHS